MKLLYCFHCNDVVRLHYEVKHCRCEKTGGKYRADGWHADIWGPCVVVGFSNPSFTKAVHQLAHDPVGEPEKGVNFDAFLIKESCPRIHRKKDEQAS